MHIRPFTHQHDIDLCLCAHVYLSFFKFSFSDIHNPNIIIYVLKCVLVCVCEWTCVVHVKHYVYSHISHVSI